MEKCYHKKKKSLDLALVLLVLCRFIWLASNGLELDILLDACRFLRLLGLTSCSCSSAELISPIPDEHVEDTGVNGSTSKELSLAAISAKCFLASSSLYFNCTENKT